MKNIIQNLTEFEFTAKDLDSLEYVTDVALINDNHTRPIDEIITEYIKNKHFYTSLNGNTWNLEGYQPTGKRIERQVIYTITSQRLDEFDKVYPIVNES
jgi:hypothetical protein